MRRKGRQKNSENKYKPEFIESIRKLRRLGLTNNEIASYYEISNGTLRSWLSRYPDFKYQYDLGGVDSSANVADTLYKKAVGFEKEETFVTPSGKKVTADKYYQPDFKAIQYYLKNRSKFDKELELKKLESKFKQDMALREFEQDKQVHADKMTLEIEKIERNTGTEDDTPTKIVFTDNEDD